jgi:DNA-binding HxlR family transcriptional regulator
MGYSTTGVSASEEEEEVWREEADALDLSLSKYLRLRIRAGRMLWSAGEFQGYKLERLVNEELEKILNETGDVRDTVRSSATGSEKSPTTINDDLVNAVLRELPKKDTGGSVTFDELQELIFGTEEEQRKRLNQALEELNDEGRVERSFSDGGFVEVNDD